MFIRIQTNQEKNQKNVFFWKNNTKFAQKVQAYLLEHFDYDQFCSQCMGLENKLVL